MKNARERMLKMRTARSVKFHAKDEHGDSVFVEFEGEEAEAILQHLLKALRYNAQGEVLEFKP